MRSVIRRHLRAASHLSIINLPLSLKSMLVVYDCLSFISGTRQTDSGFFQRRPPYFPKLSPPPGVKIPPLTMRSRWPAANHLHFPLAASFPTKFPRVDLEAKRKSMAAVRGPPPPPPPTFVVAKITPVHCASKCGQSILAPWHRFWDYYIMGEHRRVRLAPSAGQQTEGVAHNIRFHCKLQRKTAHYFSIFWPLLRFKILPNYGDRQHFQTTIPAASLSINKLKC